MSDAAREIIEVLAAEADRADDGKGWSYLMLQRMARCAQRIITEERGESSGDRVVSAFTLDTAGWVTGYSPGSMTCRWSDLTPFTQGYVEGMARERAIKAPDGRLMPLFAFSDLAPETLARIMEDCERFEQNYGARNMGHAHRGSWFFQNRQSGRYGEFPRLTFYLADDGLIRIREVLADV